MTPSGVVAVIVAVAAEVPTAVTNPVALTVATAGSLDAQCTVRPTLTSVPNVSMIVTDSWTVEGKNTPFTARFFLLGETVTDFVCPITTTVADPDGNPASGLVAVTVALPAAVFVAVHPDLRRDAQAAHEDLERLDAGFGAGLGQG